MRTRDENINCAKTTGQATHAECSREMNLLLMITFSLKKRKIKKHGTHPRWINNMLKIHPVTSLTLRERARVPTKGFFVTIIFLRLLLVCHHPSRGVANPRDKSSAGPWPRTKRTDKDKHYQELYPDEKLEYCTACKELVRLCKTCQAPSWLEQKTIVKFL